MGAIALTPPLGAHWYEEVEDNYTKHDLYGNMFKIFYTILIYSKN